MFSLPTGFVADINANATDALSALGPYISLIIGVLLAVLVVSYLISSISNHK